MSFLKQLGLFSGKVRSVFHPFYQNIVLLYSLDQSRQPPFYSIKTSNTMKNLKYPVGPFKRPETITENDLEIWKNVIAQFPAKLSSLVDPLRKDQLLWPYRPGGWTIQQVVHHCADSHMNSFIRFKLALTEDSPTIKPYFENLWAEMPDYLEAEIQASLSILKGLHRRWSILLNHLSAEDLKKEFIHPEHGRLFSLEVTLALYAWHCNHHLAHVEQALRFKGDFGAESDTHFV